MRTLAFVQTRGLIFTNVSLQSIYKQPIKTKYLEKMTYSQRRKEYNALPTMSHQIAVIDLSQIKVDEQTRQELRLNGSFQQHKIESLAFGILLRLSCKQVGSFFWLIGRYTVE
jgi:hypothetical protein